MSLTSPLIQQKPALENTKTYKSFSRFLFNVLTVCCGSFYFGITLTYLSIFPIEQIRTEFNITLDSEVTKGIFNAIVPAGAFFGAFFSSFFIKFFTRRMALLVVCGIALIGGGLTLVSYFIPMACGRFIEGIAVGLYSSICPLIINQLVPAQLKGRLGIMNQLLIVLGVDACNILTLAISTDNKQGDPITPQWRYIFSIPILTAIIQAFLLLFIYKNQTPKYLLLNGKTEEAKQLIEDWYLPQYSDSVFQRLESETIPSRISIITDVQETEKISSDTMIAIIMGFHLSVLQQFCGTNLVVIYCGDIFNQVLPEQWIKPSRIILQSIKLFMCFGATYIIRVLGRKTLIQIGSIGLGSVLLTISMCFLADTQASNYIIVGVLFCFTLIYGFTLGPIVWLYIPQFLNAKWIPFTTMSNWGGCMIVVLLFPIIQQAMGTSVYIFLFLAIWCYGSGVCNHFLLVQTKNKQRKQIQQEYKNKCK